MSAHSFPTFPRQDIFSLILLSYIVRVGYVVHSVSIIRVIDKECYIIYKQIIHKRGYISSQPSTTTNHLVCLPTRIRHILGRYNAMYFIRRRRQRLLPLLHQMTRRASQITGRELDQRRPGNAFSIIGVTERSRRQEFAEVACAVEVRQYYIIL